MSSDHPSRSERPSSSRRRSSVSSSRHESSSSRRASVAGGTSSRPSTSKRHGHSSTADADMDDETRARLARREERRRRREQEEGARTSSRSSSVPRPPSPVPFGAAPKRASMPVSKPAYFANVDFSPKQDSEEKAFDEEAADRAESSLSAKKAAYLRAVEKREQRTSRRQSGDGLGSSSEHRRTSVDSKPAATVAKKPNDAGLQSPSNKSGKHRSSRRNTVPAHEKRERKSSRRSSIATSTVEKKSSGEPELSKSGSSEEKARKREKRRSNESNSKEKKRSSKRDDDTRSHRRKHSSRSKDDESGHSKEKKRSKDDRSERHRSSRRSAELSERPPKDRSRAKSSDRLVSTSAHQREEYLKRREERPMKEDDGTKEEPKEDDFHRRREERQAKREERRRMSGDTAQSTRTRLRSASVPRYATSGSRSREPTDPRRTISGGPPEESSAAVRKSIFGTKPTRDKADTDGGLFGSDDAEAARNRLRERMAVRERAKEASMSDSEAASVSSRRSREMGVGDSALVSTRPKLVDVRRRGIASVLKQQRTNDVENKTVVSSSSSSSESESESGEDDSSVGHTESDSDESSVGDEETWTVRVSLISAVDLPLHIVPNMPLCPVLKFGMVTFPACEADSENGETTDEQKVSLETKSSTVNQIQSSGLTSLSHARVRCTGNKILSKRDNGAVEFHEEFRWDKVKRPMHTALVVELSAKASLPPTNLKESPLVSPSAKDLGSTAPQPTPSVPGESSNETQTKPGEDTSQLGDITRTQSGDSSLGGQGPSESEASNAGGISVPSISRSGSTDDDDATPMVHGAGLTGMRALWKRGRQQFEQRQVARLSEPSEDDSSKPSNAADGSTGEGQSSLGQGFLSRKTAPDRSLPSIADENVALLRPKKRRKLEMTEDLRLGSLVIPLTRLPLETAIQNKEVARIEQWYQLESYNVLVPSQTTPTWRGKGATKPLPRRSPTVQLEISFSPPEVVDDSEDDMDDVSMSELASLIDPTEPEDRATDLPSTEEKRPSLTDGANAGTVRSFARRAAGRSFQRRVASEMRTQDKKNEELASSQSAPSQPVKKVPEDPVLEPGLVDFVCVVGVKNIGDQKDDDGGRGWVNSSAEIDLLEQFPPNDEFHINNGRNVALANKVEWFCFPEGWKIWRGDGPPSPSDLNCIQRYSSSAAANTVQSTAAFDACLGCTTSFSWFVIASNSDEYGSRNVKTYGAVIKFYVPAPVGVDSTQDDYAQTTQGGSSKSLPEKKNSIAKRLWVPMGICLTSNLPIVGVMEAMLLRICETLASTESLSSQQKILPIIQKDIANLIVNFQKPISGVLHCSIPFLQGERLHVTLPPPTGLPPLPHGSSVSAVCHLLGAEGLNLMLSALLTECKIIVHSEEISNLAMVAEVTTALLYPFNWALPCIPILPGAMLEFVEAPLSYFLGIPTSSLKQIDPSVLEDVVVVDLDSDFGSSDYFDGRRTGKATKGPTPLPSSVATNIAKAVFRLLREEGEVAEEYGASTFPGSRSLPRLESESLAEREFRISVALQVCGLLRGYDDCLFKVSASQPVFNRDKFLKTAPALFETQRGNLPLSGPGNGRGSTPRTLSPRSKRFLSILVNCQHFHQFLHALDEDECAFFNEVMYTFDMNDEQEDDRMLGGYGTSPTDDAAAHLTKALQKVEDKIPTYRVERKGKKKERRAGGGWDEDDELGFVDQAGVKDKLREKPISDERFPRNLLQPIASPQPRAPNIDGAPGRRGLSEGLHKMSVQLLMELEKDNWSYEKLFQIPIEQEEGEEETNEAPIMQVREKVKLREAIGERRYRTWKLKQEQKFAVHDSSTQLTSGDMLSAEANPALDLTSLLSSMADDATSETSSVTHSSLSVSTQQTARASTLSPEHQRLADAKDRDVLRRCLERAYEGSQKRPGRGTRRSSDEATADLFFENGRDLVADAETALQNPSAQRFLVSVLSQRSRLENQKKRRSMIEDPKGARRQTTQSSVSRLETISFECLVRLCCAMLDSCMESKDYEPAYGLLTHTAGFCTIQTKDGRGVDSRSDEASQDPSNKLIYMTARIGLHPIFADLRLWEEVLRLHLKDRENEKSAEAGPALIGKANTNLVEYEAAVATLYEMLGFGIPAEELARFATRVSEDHGWFDTERGHSLLILARRLGVRREQEGEPADGGLDLMRSPNGKKSGSGATDSGATPVKSSTATIGELEWSEIGWCHPAAPSTARVQYVQTEGDERGGSSSKRLKRSAVTSIASFGSAVVASGGLDGSVFVAHTLKFEDELDEEDRAKEIVHGIHLDWGSSGSRTAAVASSLSSMDGEYGVGAVSCLAAAKGAGYRSTALSASSMRNKDVKGKTSEEEFLSAMEGCRVVAGTTAGDLRVWTVKDVYAATVLAKKGSDKVSPSSTTISRVTHGSGATSSLVSKPRGRGITDIAAGSAFSRLQFSLRGRALSGHRGGVSSMDVPSHLYRPDSLVTGGADGFIKLWSLRPPMAGRRNSGDTLPGGAKSSMFNTSISGVNSPDQGAQGRPNRSGDALSILSGHSGRVLCVKTAWHGDRLLSGGADRTVRIWDLAGSAGKCLHTLTGHLGWVTQAHYWGPNTIVTGSTDRSIALWDPRVRRSPLFILRYHHSPVSDLLVGSRTDPLMISAGGDGTIATWDFRTLSGSNAKEATPMDETPSSNETVESPSKEKQVMAIRTPIATMKHGAESKRVRQSAAVMLSRGVTQPSTVLSTGVDAIVRQWETSSGKLVGQDSTKHCEGISGFTTFSDMQSSLSASSAEAGGEGTSKHGGIITSSWDGTVRMRKFVRK